MIPTHEQRGVASPFRKLLAVDQYDGATAGLAIDGAGAVYVFQMLDWDDQQRLRVFSVSIVPTMHWNNIRGAFDNEELDGTEWVLPAPLPPPAEEIVQRAESSAKLIAVVATSGLLKEIAVWRPLDALPVRSAEPGWLEDLGLPRHGRGPA